MGEQRLSLPENKREGKDLLEGGKMDACQPKRDKEKRHLFFY